MKYFLGEAANYSIKATWRQLFVHGRSQDSVNLRKYLASRYSTSISRVILSSNGRSALAAGIKALVPKNSQIIVNGFTCQAVIEAVLAARCTPVYADITPDSLHFDLTSLSRTLERHPGAKAIIIQNTLGFPADERLFSFARRHQLVIIEDLAHSAGRFYPSGAEMGTLGDATVLSFGKGKAIDTISGGALILREVAKSPRTSSHSANQVSQRNSTVASNNTIAKLHQPSTPPRLSNSLRARFYPLFATVARGLTPSIFAKIWLGGLLKLHFIERSADARLDTERRPAHWQAKLALEQLKILDSNAADLNSSTHGHKVLMPKPGQSQNPVPNTHIGPLRNFKLVHDRPKLLQELAKNGYYFSEIWYDCPVSPLRNYQKWHFPESECPVATKISQQIINLPTFYPEEELAPALKILAKYEITSPKPQKHQNPQKPQDSQDPQSSQNPRKSHNSHNSEGTRQ